MVAASVRNRRSTRPAPIVPALLTLLAAACGTSNSAHDTGVSPDGAGNDAVLVDVARSDVTASDGTPPVDVVPSADAASDSSASDVPVDHAVDTGTDATDAGGPQCGSPTTMLSANSLTVRFANSIMARWPDPRNIGGGTHGWDYNVGIVLQGMVRVFERTGDMRYVNYIQQYVDAFVNAAGVNSGLPALPAGYALDNIEPGTMLLFLYRQTGAMRYQIAAQNLIQILNGYPRNPNGGFWHKQTYPNQMWLDGIYMAEPFVTQYGTLFASCGAFCTDTPTQQITLIAQHTLDATSGLAYHGWDQSLMATWANRTTGRSPIVWSRAMGWYAMALVDVLRYLPTNHPSRPQLIQLLQSIAMGVRATQDATTGLWYQVVDMPSGAGNFIESSGSGMLIYALKVAVDNCYIDPSYLAVAQRGWTGLQNEVQSDAMGPVITNAVQGMGVQDNYGQYVNKPRLSNSGHGLCGVLMAGSQME